MEKGIQKLFKLMGSEGCYIFSIFDLAEELNQVTDNRWTANQYIIPMTHYGIEMGFIRVEDLYVLDPAGFLGYLTNKNWNVRVESADYNSTNEEWEIWHCLVDGINHFRRPHWDSMDYSKFIVLDKRIFRQVY